MRTRHLRIAVAACGTLTVGWVVAMSLMANRGFDVSDEGFYILSYRWWESEPRNFSGFQYVYGPLFQILGHNVPALRIFRLFSVVAGHVYFAASFVRWLRTQRPLAPETRWWDAAWILAILSTGGAIFAWLPLSPGYNDAVQISALLAVGVMFNILYRSQSDLPIGAVPPLALGALIFVIALVKWSSGVLFGAMLIPVAAAYVADQGRRAFIELIALTTLGIGAACVVFSYLVGPPNEVLTPMIDLNRSIAHTGQSPTKLLMLYLSSGFNLLVRSTVIALPSLVLLAALNKRWASHPTLLALGALCPLWAIILGSGWWIGGTRNVPHYSASLIAAFLVAAATGMRWRNRDALAQNISTAGLKHHLPPIVLGLTPLAAGFGTSNPLYMMAVNCLAPWCALAAMQITRMERSRTWRRTTAIGAVATVCLVASTAGITGTLVHPYRTATFAQADTVPSSVHVLNDMKLDRPTADDLVRLHMALRPYLRPGVPTLAFDEIPGIVLMLGGRPVGEAWVSIRAPARLTANLQYACRNGDLKGDKRPIILFGRPITTVDRAALRICGLDLARDYDELALDPGRFVQRAFVPR